MRLTRKQTQLVKQAIAKYFGPNERVWVFGSRVDNSRRGGDFDFYIETDLDDPEDIIDRKLELLVQLHATLDFEGEKIDLIIKPALPGPYPPIYEIARRQGAPL